MDFDRRDSCNRFTLQDFRPSQESSHRVDRSVHEHTCPPIIMEEHADDSKVSASCFARRFLAGRVHPSSPTVPEFSRGSGGSESPLHHRKVTQVETGGKAFSMDVSLGSDKHPMRFVVDKTTTVQGHVAAGTTASVDYQPDATGQLVALTVREESPQSQ